MSAIRSAYVERPRVALLWTLAVLALLVGGYLVVRGLDNADEDRGRIVAELEQTQAELGQASQSAAGLQAERDQLAAKLQARDRRIRRLERRVDALNRQLISARQRLARR